MTIVLRPIGRGNWAPVLLVVSPGKNSPLPLEFYVGQRLELCGHVFRVSRLMP